LCNRIKSC